MIEFALKRSLEESASVVTPSDGAEEQNSQVRDRSTLILDEFDCPICTEVMRSPHEIWQCGEGHILCGNCRHNPNLPQCPACQLFFQWGVLRMVVMFPIQRLLEPWIKKS